MRERLREPAFQNLQEEVAFLRAQLRVTRLVDELLEDCLARGLGLEAALDAFLSQCARLLGACDGFVQLRGRSGPVLTRRTGVCRLTADQMARGEGVYPFVGAVLLVKDLALGEIRLGSFGLVTTELRDGEIATARALVDTMGEQLDSALLAFIALADGASPSQRIDELAVTGSFRPNAKFGRYELLSPLGAGGMAQVFVARQQGPEGVGRLVALKRVLPHLLDEQEMIDQFIDEAQVGMKLSHPNLATVYDFGRAAGTYYLAMELVRGPSLGALLSRQPVLEPPVASAILVQALRGLHAAHELLGDDGGPLALVHRDLSPQNLMVGYDGIVKVLDFGIALTCARRVQTTVGIIKGKPVYMSPEQGVGDPLDRRSDLFAAGLILHEALTGEGAFKGADDLATLDAIIGKPLERHPKLSRKEWKVLSRALEKDREQRFSSALEMAEALAEAVPPASDAELGQLVGTLFAEALRAAQAWEVDTQRSGEARPAKG